MNRKIKLVQVKTIGFFSILVFGVFSLLLMGGSLLSQASPSQASAAKGPMSSLFKIPIHNAKGEKMTLEQYQGKPILLVNIATRCGFTPQLKGLEALHNRYSSQGLVVLGVPSNDFGGQTPEANEEVLSFCQSNFGVSFPVLEKVVVKGPDKHPLFQQVIAQDPAQAEIKWNFEKFLLGPDGRLVKRFLSAVEPESAELTSAIEALLK